MARSPIAAIALLGAMIALQTFGSTAQAADEEKIRFEVTHEARNTCPGLRKATLPVPEAKLVVDIGNRKVRTRLDKSGQATVEVKGNVRKVVGKVILDGPPLQVSEYGEDKPYSFSEEFERKGKKKLSLEAKQLQDAGAASAWSLLLRGANLAKDAMPGGVDLQKVTARYGANRSQGSVPDVDGSTTHYDEAQREILIDSRTRADEFEPWVLLHEYGHHALDIVASPGPAAGGAHDLEVSIPENPALAWSEGFAHAFAAIARNDPVLGTLCRTGVDLSTKPATPQSRSGDHLNQYHEISIAGTVWGLVGQLGGGSAGLKQVFDLLHQFNGKYGGPASAREARDAFTEFYDQGDEGRQQEIGNIFDEQRLRWGFQMTILNQGEPAGQGGGVDPWVTDGTCDVDYAGPSGGPTFSNAFFAGAPTSGNPYIGSHKAKLGPLDYTNHDDCWFTSRGRVRFDNLGTHTITQTMPYLADGAHRQGNTILGVVYQCNEGPDAPCVAPATTTVRVGTGVWHRPDGQTYLDTLLPMNPVEVTVSVPPDAGHPPSAFVPIAQVDAQGRCTLLAGGGSSQDCGT